MKLSTQSWCGAGKSCCQKVFDATIRFHSPHLHQISWLSVASSGSPYLSMTSCVASRDSLGQPRMMSEPVAVMFCLRGNVRAVERIGEVKVASFTHSAR